MSHPALHSHSHRAVQPVQSIVLDTPVQVYQQTNVTCWAACFRSLNQTTGSALRFSEQDLGRLFQQFLLSGGINDPGLATEFHTLGMTFQRMSGNHFTLAKMRQALENGYALLQFQFPRNSGMPTGSGHLVLAYGIDANGVLVMNPDPAGPSYLSLSYLRSCPVVSIGRNMFPLRRPTSNPFSGLAP
jgi:hypothetical protein